MPRRVVVLDAAGTLLELASPVAETYAGLAREAGIRMDTAPWAEAFHRAFRDAPPLAFGHLDERSRRVAERDWWRAVVRATLRSADAADAVDAPTFERFFDAAWEHYARPAAWRVPEDVRPGLRALRRRGLPLAVLSNWDGRLEGLLDGLGLRGYFARILVSAGLPAAKPDGRAFSAAAEALRDLGTPPPLMIGDRVDHDVEAALAAGWGAIWLDRKAREAALPDAASRIRSLRQLVDHPLLNSA